MRTDIIKLIFLCQFMDYGGYHGHITSNDRQIHSYFWRKFLIIFILFFGDFFNSLPHYGHDIA